MIRDYAATKTNAPVTIAIVILLAFALGWGVATLVQGSGSKPLKVIGHLSGTVTAVDVDGSAVCVTPPRGAQHCSVPLMRPGQPKLQMGQHVDVSIQMLDLGGGAAEEVFVVTSPRPGL